MNYRNYSTEPLEAFLSETILRVGDVRGDLIESLRYSIYQRWMSMMAENRYCVSKIYFGKKHQIQFDVSFLRRGREAPFPYKATIIAENRQLWMKTKLHSFLREIGTTHVRTTVQVQDLEN